MPAFLKKYTYEDYKYLESEWKLIDGIPKAIAPSPVGKLPKFIKEALAIFEINSPCGKIEFKNIFKGLD